MRRPLPFLALTSALLAAAVSLSSCSSSPYAARVNNQVINQTALNAELEAWSSAPAYVTEFDKSNSAANGGVGVTVTGVSPGTTYNSLWVANQLDQMIEASIVHQHLAATGALPNQALLNASRSVSEIAESDFWTQLPPDFRQVLVERLAEQAALTPVTQPIATLQQAYQQYEEYFFSQVCVLQDAAFTLEEAQAISSSGNVNGETVCYDQAALEQEEASYRTAVLGLAVGEVSKPVKTSYGYEVLKVSSRVDQGFTPEVQQVLSLVVSEASGAAVAPAVTQLVSKAQVEVNPAYGSWTKDQVAPPTPPPQPGQ